MKQHQLDRITLVVGLVLTTIMTAHFCIPAIQSMQLVEKVISIIFISVATELMFEKLGCTGDYGIATYLMAMIHPTMFIPASFILHSTTASLPVYSELQAMILGNEYKTTFRGEPNFREIQSEHTAVRDIEDIAEQTVKSYYIRETIVLLVLAISFGVLNGFSGLLIAIICFAIYEVMQYQQGQHETVRTQHCTPIPERKGVYAIETSNLWTEKHVGVGYLYNGTFTTKYHVTNGKPIMIGDTFYKPCYYNTKADIVAYGSPPVMVDVDNGDTIAVALSGPFSNVIITYLSQVLVNSEGYIVFSGRKSLPGTSGSPFFKKIQVADGEFEYKFAGCIGWAVKTQGQASNEITEIAKNTEICPKGMSIGREEVVQMLDHPGSGKTRNISTLIQQGLNLYGRVCVAGPTRGVSYELVDAYEANPIEGVTARVLIKDTKKSRAVSKLTITTHSTALRLLLKKDLTLTQPMLWIIDEAHFPDKATQCLKHYLRHHIYSGTMKASLYEMTATAYDIKTKRWCYCDASNYPIKDTIADKQTMLRKLMTEDRKSIVFVTSIKGKEKTSSNSLREVLTAAGKKCIEINRANFTKSYPRAKEGGYDVVLTTNISECGVNLDVDVCYDFQSGPKPVVMKWNDIAIRPCAITKSQYVQRRGRVGRRKDGEYIAPQSKYELSDVNGTDAMYLDIALFAKDFNIDVLDPQYLVDEAANYSCSHEQIMYLFSEGEEATVNSALTLQMVIDSKGNLREPDAVINQVARWNAGDEVSRSTKSDIVVTAAYWDDRDSDFYWNWKVIYDSTEHTEEEKITMMHKMRKQVFNLGKALKHRGKWISKNIPSSDEYEITESEDEETSPPPLTE